MKVTHSVLIVDDDLSFLDIVREILEAKGFEVETAASAREALSKAESCFYNVAILDISLPDMEGTELLPQLLERHPDLVPIMLTGHSTRENAIQSLNRGAFAYLEKPLDPGHLLSVMAQGLEKQKLIFENRNLLEMTLQRNREITALNRRAVRLLNERAKMIEDLEQRNREVSVLLSVAMAISRSLELDRIIDAALEGLMEPLEIDCGYLQLVEESKLMLKGHRGCGPGILQKLGQETLGEGLSGQVIMTGQPLIVPDLSVEGRSSLAFLLRADLYSWAGIPLTVEQEVIGVLGVAARLKYYFSKREIELLKAIAGQIAIAVNNARLYQARQDDLHRLQEAYLGIAHTLVRAAEAHEPFGQGHSDRVALLSRRIAAEMGLPPEKVNEIELGALLHEIGKVAVPNHILRKPKEERTPEEHEVYRSHVTRGVELLGSLPLLKGVLSCIECHHERWDGSGYPRGLKGDSIPLEARIVAVADAFDALTSERPWSSALSREEAIQLIKENAGIKWDPDVVEHFLKLILNGQLRYEFLDLPNARQTGQDESISSLGKVKHAQGIGN